MADSPENHRVVAVAAGSSHSLALIGGGVVCSFGRGEDGQLGLGNPNEKLLPAIITFLDGEKVTDVACGADHTTAFSRETKTVWSWGWGDFGRLGHGHSSDVFIPHPVRALCGLDIRQIACGDCHCLAITAKGEVFSWGRNQNGQLGLGNTDDGLTPCKIPAFETIPVRMVAAGAEHSAAVSEEGGLFGWGWGRYGNLGLGDRSDRSVPEKVTAAESEKMVQVACGWRHTIVVNGSGKIFTFGWSKYGQLGHGDFEDHLVPAAVDALKDKTIKQISGGWRHSVALDDSGKLYSWGWNKFGQLGVGNTEDQNSPQPIEGLTDEVVQVSCGWRHTMALTKTSNVFSWGRGTSGQLGHGDTMDRNLPKKLDALSADGEACSKLERVPVALTSVEDASWVPPSERYAVVPDEKDLAGDASVPTSHAKRLRSA